ncbi:MAG: hypothetical protein JWO42_3640 [Chloroflexi bacterium]|jgi:hypothetical protein|nr:hypothetical protein [Chloroflexota bacterium]
MQYLAQRTLAAGVLSATCLVGLFTPVHAAAKLTVKVAFAPTVIPYDSSAVLAVKTSPGATCSATVVYANGKAAQGFAKHVGKAVHVPKGGISEWVWHEQVTKNKAGTATVRCSLNGSTVVTKAKFKLTSVGG